jgi:hypothetical protein
MKSHKDGNELQCEYCTFSQKKKLIPQGDRDAHDFPERKIRPCLSKNSCVWCSLLWGHQGKQLVCELDLVQEHMHRETEQACKRGVISSSKAGSAMMTMAMISRMLHI